MNTERGMERQIVLAVALLFAIVFVSPNASGHIQFNNENETTNSEVLRKKEVKELVIGVEDVAYFPLFDFLNEQPTFTTELFDAFAAEYGYKFIYYPMPVKRFGMWLFEKDIDLKFPDNARWNENEIVSRLTENKLVYSKPVIDLVAGTITVDAELSDRSSVKVLGTLLGFFPTLWLDDISEGQVTLYESSSTMMLIQQLIRGQLDAINLEPNVVNYYLKKLNQPTISINKNFKYEVYAYQLSSIKYPQVIKEFDAFLEANKEFVIQLRQKYELLDHTVYTK